MHYYIVTLYDLTQFEVKAFIIQEAITKALKKAKGIEIIRIERVLGV